jgi:hypothetical protein
MKANGRKWGKLFRPWAWSFTVEDESRLMDILYHPYTVDP